MLIIQMENQLDIKNVQVHSYFIPKEKKMVNKCDFCGRESKNLKARRNFPHGKRSKGITTKMCPSCNVKVSEEVIE